MLFHLKVRILFSLEFIEGHISETCITYCQSHQRGGSLNRDNDSISQTCRAFSYSEVDVGDKPIGDGAFPGLLVLSSIRNQVKEITGLKSVSSTPLQHLYY